MLLSKLAILNSYVHPSSFSKRGKRQRQRHGKGQSLDKHVEHKQHMKCWLGSGKAGTVLNLPLWSKANYSCPWENF